MDAFKKRFLDHPDRHPGIDWDEVKPLIGADQAAAIDYMEETAGEPDVLLYQGHLYVVDFSAESPKRRSVCYDEEARLGRKRNPPKDSACELAAAYGLELVGEDMYCSMQDMEPLDQKTSS